MTSDRIASFFLTVWWLLAASVSVPLAAQGDESPVGERIAAARTALQEWVANNRLYSKEQQDWRVAKELLRDKSELTQRECAGLRQRMVEVEGSMQEADQKHGDLAAKRDASRDSSKLLGERIVALETQTRDLLARLPEPLRERVAPLSQRIPAAELANKQSLSERFQHVIGVLNEINKFQRDVHLVREVRALEGGRSAEVSVLYFGIAVAYFVTDDGSQAGVGRPSDKGFVWTAAPKHAQAIAQAVLIKKGEQVANFVFLPVNLL